MVSPLDALKGAKDIAEIVKKYNDVPLYEKIVDLQGQIVEMSTEILRLHTENTELTAKLSKKESVRYEYPYYYQEGDSIPLCPVCYVESAGTKISHMSHPSTDRLNGHGRDCTVCRKFTREGPRKEPLPMPQRQPRNYWE